jgi:hypothetical protein
VLGEYSNISSYCNALLQNSSAFPFCCECSDWVNSSPDNMASHHVLSGEASKSYVLQPLLQEMSFT